MTPWISITLALISVIVSLIVYVVQQQQRQSQAFRTCSESLYSKNEIEQAAAAILLRGFLKKKRILGIFSADFSYEAKNLLVALLNDKIRIPYSLRKNIADGFSYADNLDGQDMQSIDMLGALIKPQSRVMYEITKEERYKNQRLSMQKADFYFSVIMECSVNNVNACGAYFNYTLMCGTSFKNCLLRDAVFDGANVTGVVFDEDCVLEGASFKDAVGIKDAKVKKRFGDKVEKKSLLEFLDKNGVFHDHKPEEKDNHYYDFEQELRFNVFVSKLGVMSTQQQLRYNNVISKLSNHIKLDMIDREDYRVSSQLTDVNTHMMKCDGCIIFAFEYLDVDAGVIHKDVAGNDQQTIEKKIYASPWLHIEAALANVKQMPCLIVGDENLCRDGMFDETVATNAHNMFFVTYSDDNHDLMNAIAMWEGRVRQYHSSHNMNTGLTKEVDGKVLLQQEKEKESM